MKKGLIVFLLSIGLQAAAQAPHRPLAEFGTDTIAYFRYNFEQNKARYIGERAGKLLDELDVKIIDFFANEVSPYNRDGLPPYMIYGMDIEYRNSQMILANWHNPNYKPYVSLSISFPKPYTVNIDEFRELFYKYDKFWRPEYYDFFKDFIVEEIEVVPGPQPIP